MTSGDSARDALHTFYRDANVSFAQVRPFYAPTQRVEYHSVTGPDVLEQQHVGFKVSTSDNWATHRLLRTVTDRRADRKMWNPAPAPPGQVRPPAVVPLPDQAYAFCAACRQGDNLWLAPQPVTGDGRVHQLAVPWQVRPFQGDTEIPIDRTGLFFPLTGGAERYRLEMVTTDRGVGSAYANDTRTTWNFTSTPRPERNEVLPPYGTPGEFLVGDSSPAAYQPLIFLGYDIPLGLDNTAKANRPLSFTIHASGPRPGSGRDVKGVSVQASYDDGKTWTDAKHVRRIGDGQFQVLLKHPKLSRTTGAVTLRVKAWDRFGNDVVQTITRAYGLRDPGPKRHDHLLLGP